MMDKELFLILSTLGINLVVMLIIIVVYSIYHKFDRGTNVIFDQNCDSSTQNSLEEALLENDLKETISPFLYKEPQSTFLQENFEDLQKGYSINPSPSMIKHDNTTT